MNDLIKYVNENNDLLSTRLKNRLSNIYALMKSKRINKHNLLEYSSYTRIRGLGEKAINEFIYFVEGYLNNNGSVSLDKQGEISVIPIDEKDEIPELFWEFIDLKKEKLSQRAQNRIHHLVEKSQERKLFKNDFLQASTYENIDHIGSKTGDELFKFFKNELKQFENVDIKKELKVLREQNEMDYSNSCLSLIRDYLENRTKNFPTLLFVQEFLRQKLKPNEFQILLYIGENTKSIKVLSKSLKLTYERCRQIKKNLLLEYDQRIEQILYSLRKMDISPNHYFEGMDYILRVDKLKSVENLEFSEDLIFKTLNILKDNYQLVCDSDDQCKYLVKSTICPANILGTILNNIKSLLEAKYKEDYKLSLRGILYRYLGSNFDLEKFDSALDVLKELIYVEFQLETTSKDELIIKKNKRKKVSEYIYEILKEYGEPMHVEEIALILNEYFQNKPKKMESIRSQFQNHPNLFINVGRSTYGLRKWEKEYGMKGGTIIELIYNFLEKSITPRHIYFISKEVSNYRETSLRSIEGLIKSDNLNRFVSKGSGFYTLKQFDTTSFDNQIGKIPGSWFHPFRRSIFKKGSENIDLDKAVKFGVNKYHTIDEHFRAFILRRVDKGDLILKKNKLSLKNVI